jgi:hypothetical protein
MRLFLALTLVASLAGCGSQVRLKAAPVSVSGKVSQSGKPISGVVMVFQPLGDGHMREFPVQKDGTFNGELVSGEYTYYVTKLTAQAPKKLAPKYFEADLSRTVSVDGNQPLEIGLD